MSKEIKDSRDKDVHFSSKFVTTLTDGDIAHLSSSHRCKAEVAKKFNSINSACESFVKLIRDVCPGCADAQSAVRYIRIARMEANSAIALDRDNWED